MYQILEGSNPDYIFPARTRTCKGACRIEVCWDFTRDKLFSAISIFKLSADIGKVPENLLLLILIVVIFELNLLGGEPEKPFSWIIIIVNSGSDHRLLGKLPLSWLLFKNMDLNLLQRKRDFGSSPDNLLLEKSMLPQLIGKSTR